MPLGRDRRQRRRRAAAIGGAAFAAGKRRVNQQPEQQQPAAPQQAGRGEPAEPGLSSEAIKKLQKLADLHEQNVLSDEEFEREKAKLLGG